MKLLTLIQQIYSEPSLITAEAHASIRQLLEARLDDAVHFDPKAAKRQGEYCGEKVDLPSMEVVDGIAHIPVGGVIGYKLSGFAKAAGAVDSLDILKDIQEAEADPRVKAVLFDIDSPGGTVAGTAELGDAIASMKKECAAFTDGMMASAAYWTGCSCDQVYATRGAEVGSIGVYLPVYDYTGYYEQMGIKVELIKAGKLKGIGFPGTQLNEEQRAHLKERVIRIHDEFKAHIRANRGGIADSAMEGQTFSGKDAAKIQLVDMVVTSKADVVTILKG